MRHPLPIFAAFILLAATAFPQQQKTETKCQKIGDNIDCTSTTTDTAAQQKANQEAADNIVGKPIMAWRVNRGVKKYCKLHPGEPFHWTMPDGTVVRRGVCPAKN